MVNALHKWLISIFWKNAEDIATHKFATFRKVSTLLLEMTSSATSCELFKPQKYSYLLRPTYLLPVSYNFSVMKYFFRLSQKMLQLSTSQFSITQQPLHHSRERCHQLLPVCSKSNNHADAESFLPPWLDLGGGPSPPYPPNQSDNKSAYLSIW